MELYRNINRFFFIIFIILIFNHCENYNELRKRDALIYLGEKDYSSAIAELEIYTRKEKDIYANYLLGYAYLMENKYNNAAKKYNDIWGYSDIIDKMIVSDIEKKVNELKVIKYEDFLPIMNFIFKKNLDCRLPKKYIEYLLRLYKKNRDRSKLIFYYQYYIGNKDEYNLTNDEIIDAYLNLGISYGDLGDFNTAKYYLNIPFECENSKSEIKLSISKKRDFNWEKSKVFYKEIKALFEDFKVEYEKYEKLIGEHSEDIFLIYKYKQELEQIRNKMLINLDQILEIKLLKVEKGEIYYILANTEEYLGNNNRAIEYYKKVLNYNTSKGSLLRKNVLNNIARLKYEKNKRKADPFYERYKFLQFN